MCYMWVGIPMVVTWVDNGAIIRGSLERETTSKPTLPPPYTAMLLLFKYCINSTDILVAKSTKL